MPSDIKVPASTGAVERLTLASEIVRGSSSDPSTFVWVDRRCSCFADDAE